MEEGIYQKYDTNCYNLMVDLGNASKAIVHNIENMYTMFSGFSEVLENIIKQVPSNTIPTSFQSLLSKVMKCNFQITSLMTTIPKIYQNLSDNLDNRNVWEEKLSSVERIKNQQLQEMYNIQLYRSLALFVNDYSTWLTTLNNTSDAIEDKKFVQLSEHVC